MITLRHIYTSLLCGALLIGVGACSSGSVRHSDSAVIDTDTATIEDDSEEVTYAVMTDRGVESIKCNMLVSDMQPSIKQLYDSIIISHSNAYTIYRFIFEGYDRFKAYDFGDGAISMIEATDPGVIVETPNGDISLDMPFTNVMRLPGVTTQYQNFDDGGIWSWVWRGLYFLPSQQNLSHRLSSKLYTNGTPPTIEDFDDNVTIEYIGTGLPY